MKLFHGSIEFLSGQPVAIVTITDGRSPSKGTARIHMPTCPPERLRESLYDSGYTRLLGVALSHGGRLASFTTVESDAVPTRVLAAA